MAHGGAARKASSTQGKTSRISPEPELHGPSFSQADSPEELRSLLQGICNKNFSHGHPQFNKMLFDLMELHDRKNKNYAGGGDSLGNFYRVANMMNSYQSLRQGDPAVAAIGMVVKQIDNVLWALNNDRFYSESSIDEHLQDIAVYMLILRCIRWNAAPTMMTPS